MSTWLSGSSPQAVNVVVKHVEGIPFGPILLFVSLQRRLRSTCVPERLAKTMQLARCGLLNLANLSDGGLAVCCKIDFLNALVEVIVGVVFLVVILHGHDRCRLRLLFEVLDVVRCVPPLHGS